MKTITKKAMNKAPKVIEINLVDSTNRLEDFVSRITASRNNIDTYPDVPILVLFAPKIYPRTGMAVTQDNGKRVIEKYEIVSKAVRGERAIVLKEGDGRMTWDGKTDYYYYIGSDGKVDFILANAKHIIKTMAYKCKCLKENMGFDLSTFDGSDVDNRNEEVDNKIKVEEEKTHEEWEARYKAEQEHSKKIDATKDNYSKLANEGFKRFVEYCTKGCLEQGYVINKGTIIANNGEQVVYEDSYDTFHVVRWSVVALDALRCNGFNLTEWYAYLDVDGKYESFADLDDETIYGECYDISLVKRDSDTVILTVNGVSSVFKYGDFFSIYKWLFDDREKIQKGNQKTIKEIIEDETTDKETLVAIAKMLLGAAGVDETVKIKKGSDGNWTIQDSNYKDVA